MQKRWLHDHIAFIAMNPKVPLQETRLSQYHNYLNLEDIYDAHREALQAECLHTVPVRPAFVPSACPHWACLCLHCWAAQLPLSCPPCSHRQCPMRCNLGEVPAHCCYQRHFLSGSFAYDCTTNGQLSSCCSWAENKHAFVKTGGGLHQCRRMHRCHSLPHRRQAHQQAVCAFIRMLCLQNGCFYDFQRNHRSVRSTIVHFQVHPASLTLPQTWSDQGGPGHKRDFAVCMTPLTVGSSMSGAS